MHAKEAIQFALNRIPVSAPDDAPESRDRYSANGRSYHAPSTQQKPMTEVVLVRAAKCTPQVALYP